MNKKYILFGSGVRAKRILQVLEKADVEYIIDNDESKWGKKVTFNNKEYGVFSPEVLLNEPLDELEIIIGSTFISEMIYCLEQCTLSCSKGLLTRILQVSDKKGTFTLQIASFVDKDRIYIQHNFAQIGANRFILYLSDKPCAIRFDRVLLNDAETTKLQEIFHINGEWLGEETIQFPHYNPAIFMEKCDTINTIYMEYHFIEPDYKKAFEFMKSFYNNMSDFSKDISHSFISEEDHEPIEFGDGDVKPIAYYLPQFHQTAYNDEWWEKGFTEWTNVTKAYPLFEGHYQPHLPIDMGFYDLNNKNILKRQIELAKKYGIYGFCYYYYHFEDSGRLLEMPLKRHLLDKELDFPFCIFWDTEDWTKRWIGEDQTIFRIGHDDGFYLNVIKSMAEYLKDSRYIRIKGKPLIIIYRPQKMINLDRLVKLWRDYCVDEGIGEVYLMSTKPENHEHASIYQGFDGVNEFIWGTPWTDITHTLSFYEKCPCVNVYSYEDYINCRETNSTDTDDVFLTALTNFDNSARYKDKPAICHGATPSLYKEHICRTIRHTKAKHEAASRYMFIFAWNEWAEGAHLEPDRKYGYAWLKATREAILESRI